MGAIEDARAACDSFRWGDAYRLLSEVELETLDVDDLDRLATSAYLTGHDEDGFTYWVRAHQLCIDEGAVHHQDGMARIARDPDQAFRPRAPVLVGDPDDLEARDVRAGDGLLREQDGVGPVVRAVVVAARAKRNSAAGNRAVGARDRESVVVPRSRQGSG